MPTVGKNYILQEELLIIAIATITFQHIGKGRKGYVQLIKYALVSWKMLC